MKTKILMTIALMCAAVQGAWAESVSVTYNRRSWNTETLQVETTVETCSDYTLIEGDYSDDWMQLGDTDGQRHYYVVKDADVKRKVLVIVGDVRLILCDNAKIYCNHVKLEVGNTLRIYSQSDGSDKGVVEVYNKGGWRDHAIYSDAAGIGSGGDGVYMGSLYVHGGKISVTNGYACNGAGIGGGYNGRIGGEVVVYNGHVYCDAEAYGAAIGGGKGADQGGEVKVYGGTVEAYAGSYGAGIGGGDEGSGGKVTIYGGKVTASSSMKGAGIGGGNEGNGGQVSIYGGEVYALGGGQTAWFTRTLQPAIGGGDDCNSNGTLELADGMKVKAKEDFSDESNNRVVVTNAERVAACQNNEWVNVSTCDHTAQNSDAADVVTTYTIDDDVYMTSVAIWL